MGRPVKRKARQPRAREAGPRQKEPAPRKPRSKETAPRAPKTPAPKVGEIKDDTLRNAVLSVGSHLLLEELPPTTTTDPTREEIGRAHV